MLPVRKLTLKTNLQFNEVEHWFIENIHPINSLIFDSANKTNKPFKGKIAGSQFQLIPDVSYRNSFLPLFKGIIKKETDGSEIKLKVGIHPVIATFVTLIFLASSFWAILPILENREYHFGDIMMLIGILFVISIMTLLFYIESERCIKKMKDDLHAEEK